MLAAVYRSGGSLSAEDVAVVPPGPGEVQLEVAFTGICGTDLHISHGAMDSRVGDRGVLGHEMSGTVAALGAGVRDWSVGEAVTVLPVLSCGACPACVGGHGNVCARLTFLGIDAPGSMQERWNVPAAALVRVPPGVALDEAALVEPLAVAVHDVRRSGLVPEEKVLVVGGGPVGVLVAAVARRVAADVVVVEPDPHRRKLAEEMGLVTLDPSTDVAGAVQAWTAGAGVSVAFEVSGVQAGVDLAVDSLAAQGRLVVVAIHTAPRPVDLHRFFWRELTMLGARLYDRADFDAAVQLVADGQVPLRRLLTHVVPLRRVGDAFETLSAGDAVMKVLVDCRPEGAR